MLLYVLLIALSDPAAGFKVSAEIPTQEMKVGETYKFVLTIEAEGEIHSSFKYKPGESVPKDMLHKPILQLDVPEGIELTDKVPPREERQTRDWLELYLDKPFGRLITEKKTEIPFKLTAAQKPGATLGMNIITYVDGETPEQAVFIRRRIELPLNSGGRAQGVDGRRSDWGMRETLHIGDKVAAFDLPVGDGTRLNSADYVGKQPLFILTYRADW